MTWIPLVIVLTGLLLAVFWLAFNNPFSKKVDALQKVLEESSERARLVSEAAEAQQKRGAELDRREEAVRRAEDEIGRRLAEVQDERVKATGLDQESARAWLRSQIEAELVEEIDSAALAKRSADESILEVGAKQAFLTVVQRASKRWTGESTLVSVNLPSEESKGRLIGREGRNIKAFEQVTGADLVIDETPGMVFVSCLDPERRLQAQLTLMNLILDGRIHPGRIEEVHAETVQSFEANLPEIGKEAARVAGVTGLSEKTLAVLGRLKFRTSQGQNVLEHSIEVSQLAACLAAEVGIAVMTCRKAAFLHDIGKALGPEWGTAHALAGMEFLRQEGLDGPTLTAVGAHHYDIPASTPESVAVIVADSISGGRTGARHASVDLVLNRVKAIEAQVLKLKGVENVQVYDSGREIRVFVRPSEVLDSGLARLAQQASRVAKECSEYPLPVRVTVVRDSRIKK